MKSLLFMTAIIMIAASCSRSGDGDITCTFDSRIITIKNANTTIRINNDLYFEILFEKNGKLYPLIDENKTYQSVFLHDSINEKISFARKFTQINKINDKFGKGKNVKIEAISQNGRIACIVSLSSYNSFPNVILVQSSFKNISEKNYYIRDYTLNHLCLRVPPEKSEWWSFQGASYFWGTDFVFKLPKSFNRENYLGLNAIRYGGGIPLVDVWNKEFGLALAYIGEKPYDISLPVKADSSEIQLEIKDNYKAQLLKPNDSIVSIQTAIIVHQNDFYDPLRTYSELMKSILPEFLKPVELAYEPEWCTWGYNQNFKPENILSKLERLKSLGIKSVIFDDGWSLNHGDWIPDPVKFPRGDEDFKELINKIHESGFKTWLWWVPGYVDSTSGIAIQHPDWLIKNKDGSVHSSFGLCPAYKPVQDHYKKLVQKFIEEYKIDGFKLDFGVINSAAPCYDPNHHHKNAYESYRSTPLLFKNIYEKASQYNPDILLEYCACSIPPTIFHLQYTNLAVTSDPNISQITERIKMYKALMGDNFPVLEEYCGVLAGPLYQLTVGAGGVPGTFSTYLDEYHEKWLNVYHKYQLSKGKYLNLYDIGFDYPEAHVIKKDDKFYYAFYTHSWNQLGSPPERWYRFGTEFDSKLEGQSELKYPKESFSGKVDFRGLDEHVKYKVFDYANNKELGTINGDKPYLIVSFDDYLLLELKPL